MTKRTYVSFVCALRPLTDSASMSRNGGCQPALLIRQSRRPNRANVASMICLISSGWRTSAVKKTHCPGPSAVSSLARASPASAPRAQMATLPPSRQNTRAQPSPIRLLPPVISTTQPAKRPGTRGESFIGTLQTWLSSRTVPPAPFYSLNRAPRISSKAGAMRVLPCSPLTGLVSFVCALRPRRRNVASFTPAPPGA